MKKVVKNSEVKVVKRTQTTEVPLGRPVNPNSARQILLS